jgi:multidrug efflux pump
MNLSAPFIKRPIATILLTVGVALAGVAAFFALPVASLPQVDYPAISVSATLAGASPETMASSVATPLEHRLAVLAGVNEITSSSSTGRANISLQFDLNRNIDGAARDVEAAINASRADLPSTLVNNPTYRKRNAAAQPIIIMALTSKSLTPGQIYDKTNNIIEQALSQVQGVGEVTLGGGSQPAVRVEIAPFALNKYGVSMEDVRAAIESANAVRPKGDVSANGQKFQIYTSDTGTKAVDYRDLVVAWRDGGPIRLSDVADVNDDVADIHTTGLFSNPGGGQKAQPAIIVQVIPQPDANIIATVNAVRAAIPHLQSLMPNVNIQVASDTTNPIRRSLRDIEITLAIAILLVIVVVSVFLRSLNATVIPAVATIVSLLGALGIMYALGFTVDNLSLMSLTVAAGFVVDDAIVVLENTSRHIENGMNRFQAALRGAQEVGFTVLSMSISLCAVFIPLLFMGGQVGRLFREFAITLSGAVMISLLVSLTTTPMLCAYLLRPENAETENRFQRFFRINFDRVLKMYETSLDWALDNKLIILLLLFCVIGLNIYLYTVIPKGFFPTQDSGRLNAGIRADQSISAKEMGVKMKQIVAIIEADPAVSTITAFTGTGGSGGAFLSIDLKPKSQRADGGQAVINRLRPKTGVVSGVTVFLNAQQDLRMGGRQSNATYQYTLKSDNTADLKKWATNLADELETHKELTDVNTDQQDNGVETYVDVNRDTAAKLGVNLRDVDNALYDNFGQRSAATIYEDLNQYSVIMEAAPKYSLSPESLTEVYVPANGAAAAAVSTGATVDPAAAARAAAASAAVTTTTTAGGTATAGAAAGATAAAPAPVVQAANPALRDPSSGNALSNSVDMMVPLSAIASFKERSTAVSVNHQDGELATTVSFNLADGVSLSDAQKVIAQAEANISMPINVRGSFQGTAKSFTDSLSQEPILIGAALLAIYIVLGVLYESLIHPITVISTLPSAGVGAVIALMIMRMEFTIIALIGVFLLIGLVKKNAIMIIDFALEAQRSRNITAEQAVRDACLLRFRPIMMTTFAAGLGALPLAIGLGEGSELRQPLGVAIIGGLIASQFLTLLTTPVVYVYLDRLRRKKGDERFLARDPGIPRGQPA